MRINEIMGNHPNSDSRSSVSRHRCLVSKRCREVPELCCLVATPLVEMIGECSQTGFSEGMPPRGIDQRLPALLHEKVIRTCNTGGSGRFVNMTQSILFLALMNNMFLEPVICDEPMPDLFALPFVDDDESDDTLYIIDTGAGAHLSQWRANGKLVPNKKTINFVTANGRGAI